MHHAVSVWMISYYTDVNCAMPVCCLLIVQAIRFVGGFAMAGDISGDDYINTQPDPIQAFAEPIMVRHHFIHCCQQ
jgi:hypothetical protein